MPRVFLLGLQEHVAVGHFVSALAAVEVEVVDVVDALHVHREALEPVSEFARDGRAFEAGDLLEVGELRYLHAVAPALPAEPPGAERRTLPVVLDEADVVQLGVDADRGERARDRGPEGRAATASGSPGTDSSAAAGSGSRRSGRPSAGARAARRRRSTALAPARAASSPDGRCRRRPPCRRAAGSRSRDPPRTAAASGSSPGTNAPGACGRECRRS